MSSNIHTAQERFDALPATVKLTLLREIFNALEYDGEGEPGSEWSSDTLQAIGDLFHDRGVDFTPPRDRQPPPPDRRANPKCFS